MAQASAAAEEIFKRVRTQQIENDVTQADLRTRSRLDELRSSLEQDNDYETYEQRFTEGARAIVDEESRGLNSPMHRRLWGERIGERLVQAQAGVRDLSRRRAVETARAGVITTVSEAERRLTDPNSTEADRAENMGVIETTLGRAVKRGMLGADDAARIAEGARTSLAEFEQRVGRIAAAQVEEDRIWAESGGDLDTALEMVRDGFTGLMREDLETRIGARANQVQAGRRVRLDQAMSNAYTAIEQRGTLDGISGEDRAVIVAEGQMDTLRTYMRARNNPGGEEGWTQLTRRSQLVRDNLEGVAAEDAGARFFANLDLRAPLDAGEAAVLGVPEGTVLSESLMPDDINALRERQRQMRGEVPVSGDANGNPVTMVDQAFNAIIPRAEALAVVAGLNVTSTATGGVADSRQGERNRENAADLAQQRQLFRSYLYGEARAFVQTNNRVPNGNEIEAIARSALAQSTRRRPGFMGFGQNVETYNRFEAGGERAGNIRVPFNRIPTYQVERLTRAWAQAGNQRPPTTADIEEMYMRDLAGRNE